MPRIDDLLQPVLIKYRGKGVLIYDQESVKIDFDVVQLHNSEIFIYTATKDEKMMQMGFWDSYHDFKEIKGKTETNVVMSFKATGLQWVDFDLHVTTPECAVSWFAAEIEMESELSDSKEKDYFLEAPLTNLRFTGNEKRIDESEHHFHSYSILSLNLSGAEVEIIPVEDYEKKLKIMHFTNVCTITSYLRVPCKDRLPQEQLVLLNNTCKLLSLAKGTIVSWPYYQILDKDGNIYRRYHRYTTMSSYNHLEVIHYSSMNDLKTFLESTYQLYTGLVINYDLRDIIDVIALAKQIHILPELRGLYVVSAIDVLRGRWAKKHKRAYIFERNSFDKYKSIIKGHILKYLDETFDICDQQLGLVGKKIPELNRPAFRDQLKELICDIDANLNDTDIDRFGRNRNDLVHEAHFDTDNVTEELMNIFYFADSLILALLNYRGRYVDARTGDFV